MIWKGVIRPTEPRGVPLRAKMLPRFLKNVGYETHGIGKWHLGFCSWDYTPLKRGFDTFYGFYTGASDYYTHKRAISNESKKEKPKEYLDLRNNTESDDTKEGHYSTHLFGSVAEEIVRSRDPEDPMFLYLSFQSVHSPLQVPRNYSDIYSNIKDHNRRLYLGMVTAMDEAVGRLVTALHETGHYSNSVIIFTTDNGGPIRFGASNWPLRGGKATLWEGGIRAPAFIHSPLLPNPGTVTNQLHHITDWFSTIVNIAGVNPPKVDGMNHWDALVGLSDHPRKTMICNIQNVEKFKAAVRFNEHKMLIGRMASVRWASSSASTDKSRTESLDTTLSESKAPLLARRHSRNTPLPVRINGHETNKKFGNIQNKSLPEGTDYLYKPKNAIRYNDARIEISRWNKPLSKNNDLMAKDFVRWGDLKNHTKLEWEPKVVRTLGNYLTEQTKIRLFNIKDDPEERHNLSAELIYKLQAMMTYLSQQLHLMITVPPKTRIRVGHPSYWNNVWSSGWCQSKW
ncbi:arylsulfatase B-like isoform X2 [Palaemon carinicauda]|uniref:arylsulfatase B-like isoform X2 n=1 Tax=Palaemon carinicauda TaxID=392227 RepID=UPI0035B5FB49